MGKLNGKKLLLLGERDGVPGPAMEACLKDSGIPKSKINEVILVGGMTRMPKAQPVISTG